MDQYFQDVFYDVTGLSLRQKEQLCRDAHQRCFNWRVDELVGWARQEVDMGFEEILAKMYVDAFLHFVFIHRRGYEKWKDTEGYSDTWCLEVGFVSGAHYLWIYLTEDQIPYFTLKYHLHPTRPKGSDS